MSGLLVHIKYSVAGFKSTSLESCWGWAAKQRVCMLCITKLLCMLIVQMFRASRAVRLRLTCVNRSHEIMKQWHGCVQLDLANADHNLRNQALAAHLMPCLAQQNPSATVRQQGLMRALKLPCNDQRYNLQMPEAGTQLHHILLL